MLKNQCNNPWFIGGLGVFASIYLGWSIAKPLFFEETPDFAGDEPGYDVGIDGGDQDESLTQGQSYSLSSIERAAVVNDRAYIGWLDDVERDPFADSPLAVESIATTELPTVEALFLSDGVQAAVIENRLVHVGDMVAQFEVTEIGKDFVQVSRSGKHFRLEPKAG